MQITAILTPDGTAKASNTASQTSSTGDFSNYMDENTSNNSLASIFKKASDTYGVSETLLTAMAKQESNFNANSTSRCGAMGIMQLMPATATALGCTDAYDPEQNIMAGASYISQLLQKYNGNVSLALAAYNAGGNNVDKYGGIPPFAETQDYVAKITGYMNEGVTLPDGTKTAGTSDTSSVTSSLLNNLDENKLKQLLNKIFSYDDYLGLINQLAACLKDAAGTTQSTGTTATGTNSTASANATAGANATTGATATTGANAATTNTTASSSTTPANATFSVKVTGSNPTDASATKDSTAATNSDLYYASKNIKYNNSVLNLMNQNSKKV
jgi:hypothetical protein